MPSAANPQAPVVPNFFMEIKAPSEDENLVRCWACYNGALGARAIHSLRNYGRDEPVYNGNGNTFTATYDPGTGILQMYVTQVTASNRPEPPVEYHTTKLGSWNLKDDKESFVRGVTAFRNARDLVKELRDRVIEEANAKARELAVG
ncbi:hypothetical protein K469DRAFT_763375 [Zopfia rhizophila CBS 207.26]|uniref:Uncharacterized protein n=1 Tax=Zopfia rhizophila CBS 207.26 TaxID=1314779 RepID=A0A6A6DBV7_9PEZI|nr:hypothetical protein K469DRAFT_763375 [Zopfia rhizophila CBS 207.26]